MTGVQTCALPIYVDLVREVPEAKKPRNIPIGKGASATLIEARTEEAVSQHKAVRKAA